MENVFNGLFGKIGAGMCRLSYNGGIAVKTSAGYKTYNVETGRLTNCDSFVFPVGDEFFFCLPTSKVSVGDIVLINGKPKCVISFDKKTITVINYEDSTIDTVVPERHVFMGETYMYGKIVSMFGDAITKKGSKGGMNSIVKYMMVSEMFKTNSVTNTSINSMLPLMMMNGGGFENVFSGLFNFVDEDDEPEVETKKKKASKKALLENVDEE